MELPLYAVIFFDDFDHLKCHEQTCAELLSPLIQILLGIACLFVLEENFHLDTELFFWPWSLGLSLISIAGEEADITCLKALAIIPYLILAIFISTISLGWAAHSLWLSLPLSSPGWQLGQPLAYWLSSLLLPLLFERFFSFPKRVSNILKGEGLLNDASGLVAFSSGLAPCDREFLLERQGFF